MENRSFTIFGIPLFNRVTGFFFLLCSYYVINVATSPANMGMSGQLLAESNPWNRFMAGLIILYSLYFSFRTNRHISNRVYQTALLFLLYMVIRYIFSFIEDSKYAIAVAGHLFNVVYWLSVLLFSIKCFCFIDKKSLDKLIILLICIVLMFLLYRSITQKAILASSDILAGINVAGSAYMLAPLIIFVLKGRLKIVILLICVFICIYSAKRQALVGMFIILFFVLKNLVTSYFKQFKFVGVLIIISVIFGGRKYIEKSFEDLLTRQNTMEEKGGAMDSGRSDLRGAAMKGFMASDITVQIVGGGTAISSLYIKKYYGKYNAPHCGFVEILCDYGIVGEIILCCFFFHLFRWRKRFPNMSKEQLVYLSMVMVWIYFNIVSHIGNTFAIYLSMTFGYLYNNRRNISLDI